MRRTLAWLLFPLVLAPASHVEASIWPNAVQRVEAQLRSDDVSQRRRGAKRLSELPEGVGRRLGLGALDDPDVEVKLAAQAALRALGERTASARVVAWLSDPERRLRLAAAELLAWSPAPSALLALSRSLADPDPTVRSAAAIALGASGRAEAVLPLLGHLDDDSPVVRGQIVLALARSADPRAVVPLIGKIQDARPEVRRAVALALGDLGDPRATSALILALRDSDESVKVAALESLGRLGDVQALLAIATAVDEADARSPVRSAGLVALARLGTPEALDRVIAALGRDDSQQPAALEALAVAGAAAVPKLVQCLQGQPAAALADGCARGLSHSGERGGSAAVAAALRRGAVGPAAALESLGRMGDKALLPTVLEYLESAAPDVRRAAIAAAAALLDPSQPDGRAVDPIERALERARSTPAEHLALVQLLGRTGAPRAARVLVPLAVHSDPASVRVAALEALGRTGGPGSDQALLESLGAEDGAVRMAAAVAAWRKASGASARVLLDRLARAAEQDRVALALALGGALSRSKDERDVTRALVLLRASRGGERDAYIEAIGRHSGAVSLNALERLVDSTVDVADRAKVAEVLAGRADGRALAARLARDVDGAVRANALWSLGVIGAGGDRGVLIAGLTDRDPVVAANAAVALGRFTRAAPTAASKAALCKALDDTRSAVRAGALAGLRSAGHRCRVELDLLEHDASEVVREAAARLVARVAGPTKPRDSQALGRCAKEDVSSRVAAACSERQRPDPVRTEPVAVFVVPLGESTPVPRAPFALRLADGTTRLGLTDRRGLVLELAAPRGEVSLDVPAPLR